MSTKICDNGNRIGVGKVPSCTGIVQHHIANPRAAPIELCDQCFQIAVKLGLVTDVNIGKEEFDRREIQRHAR